MCAPDNNALKQEEARRVIIHTMNRELLKVVRYQTSLTSSGSIAFGVTIDPQMSMDEVAEIRLIITAGDKVLSDTRVPVDSDSTIYRFVGLWSLPKEVEEIESPMIAQAVVSTKSGAARESNPVSIPMIVEVVPQKEFPINDDGEAFGGLDEGTYIEQILFFESSDSCLSAMQEQKIDEQIATIVKQFTSNPDNSDWTISVSAQGEQSENPEVNVGRMQSEKASITKMYDTFEGIVGAPTFQMPLYIMPSEKSINLEEAMAEGGLIAENYMERINKLYDAWYGDRSGEVREAQEELSSLYSYRGLDEEMDTTGQFNTLITNRANSVAQYLQSKLDSAIADTVFVEFRSYVNLETKYSPEGRFYTRSARIRIQYYDPRKYQEWEDEYESYDEYEEEDASEYDIEFDEAQLEEE